MDATADRQAVSAPVARRETRQAHAGPWGTVAETLPIAIACPILWFPWRWPALTLVGLLLLPLAWIVSWRRRGWLDSGSGLEEPLVFVLLTTCVAAIPVTDWQLGLPKLVGMALGAAVLVSIANVVTTNRYMRLSMLAVVAATFAIAAVGLLGTGWNPSKIPFLRTAYARFPSFLVGSIPDALNGTSTGTIHPNELAGVLVILVPVVLANAIGLARARTPIRSRRPVLSVAFGLGVAFIGSAVLVLTGSRSGWAGLGVSFALLIGAVVLEVLRSAGENRILRVTVPTMYAALLIAGSFLMIERVSAWVSEPAIADGGFATFASRVELWDRSMEMLQDFPFTGIGIGQFDPVLHALYIPLLVGPREYVPHPHNQLLDFAVELGIPGAVAFILLVVAFFRQCARAVRHVDPVLRWSGIGLALGVIAFATYGTVDAIGPGARAGLVLWIVLGLGAAAGNLARQNTSG